MKKANKPDPVAFVERVEQGLGVKLLEYQKVMLRTMCAGKKPITFIMPRHCGEHIKENPKNV